MPDRLDVILGDDGLLGIERFGKMHQWANLMEPILVTSPTHRCDARPAVAAARAGVCGILDITLAGCEDERRSALRELATYAGGAKWWGVRWDPSASSLRTCDQLQPLVSKPWPLLLIGGLDFQQRDNAEILAAARRLARCVLAEAGSVEEAARAEEAGFDGTILVGSEALQRCSEHSAYILLQQAHGRLRMPYWVQGELGPQTTAAALLAGATGAVLKAMHPGAVKRLLVDFRAAVERTLRFSKAHAVITPESEFAKGLGIKYPILQRPMARVSDNAEFCRQVADHGGMPLLALASLGRTAAERLLAATAAKLGNRPWGVGLQGYLPEAIRRGQIAALKRTRPACALLSGGSADQARALEDLGICTFFSVTSVAELPALLAQGGRKYVLQGSESGGRVGTTTSFSLWQAAIDEFLAQPKHLGKDFQVVFAGGIHDALSAAMAAVIAAPLAARGVKIGLMMGTAYLLTPEALNSGAISGEFQRQAIECRQTRLLPGGPAGALRCAATAAVDDFSLRERQLAAAGRTAEEIRYELEMFQVGRRQLAAKGIAPAIAVQRWGGACGGTSTGTAATAEPLLTFTEDQQRRFGLFEMGEAALLRSNVQAMAELHEAVGRGPAALLQRAVEAVPTWSPRKRRKAAKEPLAIVGLGCLFPQASNVEQYWQNIIRRLDTVREAPGDRWRAEDFFHPDRLKPDQVYSKWGAFLDPLVFDPLRYHIPPVALASIEPVQLLALEVARQALDDAGYQRPEFPRQRTTVIFAAAGTHDIGMAYSFRTALRHWLPQVGHLDEATRKRILAELEDKLPKWTEDSFPGFLPNVVSGRVCNRFDLGGTNFAVDAACASSFAALHVAVEQLRSGTCDAALVGAVDGSNNAFCYMSFAKTHALSPRGRSRPFDESADGITLGEGIAAVVLKRLCDAQRDGDKIYAVIRGIGSSSDGKARSLTAPSPDGQIVAMRRAYEDAGLSPATLSLIEAHGTGTTVGDRVEVQALANLFAAEGAAGAPCAIGSIKSMIGHTKTAAGLASLVKTVLAIEHRVLPPTIGVERPNAVLRQDNCPLYVSAQSRPWLSNGSVPRRAGVSAFGFGGTNFHVVLEEFPDRDSGAQGHVDLMPRAAELFAFSRSRRQDLLEAVADLERQVTTLLDLQAADIVHTPAGEATPLPVGAEELAQLAHAVYLDEQRQQRPAQPAACRLALLAQSLADLREKLRVVLAEVAQNGQVDDPRGIYYSEAAPFTQQQVCFLFSGQGSQAVDMLKDPLLHSPWAFGLFEKADRDLSEFFAQPLSRLIYPIPVFTEEERQRQQQQLNETRVAQPALGLVEVFGHELLGRFGVRPGMVAGHSYGELVALYAAGVYTAEDLLRLSAVRGQAVYEAGKTTPGAMAAVLADAPTTAAALAESQIAAQIANYNSPAQTVIAGPIPAIDEAVQKFPQKGLRIRKLPVTAAFHTPAVRPARERMEQELAGITLHKPRVPVFSNTTGSPYPASADEIRRLQSQHLTSPVQFSKLLAEAYRQGARVFVEVGPGGVLTGLVRQNLQEKPHSAMQLDDRQRPGDLQLAHVLCRLLSLGLPVRVETWFENRRLGCQPLAALFEQLRGKHQRKATDWVVTPGGARPWAATANHRAAKPISPPEPMPDVPPPAKTSSSVMVPQRKPPEPRLSTAHGISEPRIGQSRSPREIFSGHLITPITKQLRLEASIMEQQAQPRELTDAPAGNDTTAEVMAQFQSTMARWLEMQQQQQLVSQQFLEMQRAVMLACLQGGAVPSGGATIAMPGSISGALAPLASPAILPTASTPDAPPGGVSLEHASVLPPVSGPVVLPAAAGAVTARKMRVPPAPVLPTVTPATLAPPAVGGPSAVPVVGGGVARPASSASGRLAARVGERPGPSVAQASAPPSAAPAKPTTPAPPPAAATPATQESTAAILAARRSAAVDDGIPTLETFRKDLLHAVGERTGYPIDMLDETLELEAGLGIDSIKTIEIFDMLSKYHGFLLGGEDNQREALASFAKLRTLGDILNVYATNVGRRQQPQTVSGNGHSVEPPLTAAPKPAAAAAAVAAAPAVSPAAAPAVPRPTAAEAPASKPSTGAGAAADGGPPPLEVFRRDLLEVVSERTGYPTEMLDETLELEAGLGIDSIKTIEIFDMLSKYHAYLLGGESQEETLATFAKLRTLADILAAYESNTGRQRQQAPAAGPAVPSAATPARTAVQVQRAVVQAVPAPPESDGQKKNGSLAATSY